MLSTDNLYLSEIGMLNICNHEVPDPKELTPVGNLRYAHLVRTNPLAYTDIVLGWHLADSVNQLTLIKKAAQHATFICFGKVYEPDSPHESVGVSIPLINQITLMVELAVDKVMLADDIVATWLLGIPEELLPESIIKKHYGDHIAEQVLLMRSWIQYTKDLKDDETSEYYGKTKATLAPVNYEILCAYYLMTLHDGVEKEYYRTVVTLIERANRFLLSVPKAKDIKLAPALRYRIKTLQGG